MIGAMYGDIVGSPFEKRNLKLKVINWFDYAHRMHQTDDGILTMAVAQSFIECQGDYNKLQDAVIRNLKEFARRFPGGYGRAFKNWVYSDESKPYNSWGNGSAMRVSPCAWVAKSLDEAIVLSRLVTGVTHNHPEGIKGAEAVTVAIFMALHGSTKDEIRSAINTKYYALDFTLDEIRDDYRFDVSCQGSVPQAIEAFLESTSFDDAAHLAVSIGGDSDTIAAIACSIAEAYYGVTELEIKLVEVFTRKELLPICEKFTEIFNSKKVNRDKKQVYDSKKLLDLMRYNEDKEICYAIQHIEEIVKRKCSRCDTRVSCMGCVFSPGDGIMGYADEMKKIMKIKNDMAVREVFGRRGIY